MTAFPNFLDHFAENLLELPAQTENPHHRAVLETYFEVQHLERRLLDAVIAPHPDNGPDTDHTCTEILIDRLAVGQELAALLAADCGQSPGDDTSRAETCSPPCCADPETDDEEAAGWHGCRRK
ncbi:hypothetical protein ACIQCR_31360 [Streptomyces sp. NPDC093249]|uniref:hypothetical protein n=1 Tax=unclassified Streptomyces TaxID=2593676 RepID=UPI00344B9D34